MAKPVPELLELFRISGELIDIEPLTRGHINETYVSSWRTPAGDVQRYVHQLVNRTVFKDVPSLMRNIERVTAHIRAKLEAGAGLPNEETLEIIPLINGGTYVRDDEGDYWRTYRFIEGVKCHTFCSDEHVAYEGGCAFGSFTRHLADLPPGSLSEPIQRFQDPTLRFEQFEAALQQPAAGRVARAAPEIEKARAGMEALGELAEKIAARAFPVRVTHADLKITNVLFSERDNRAVGVVDLDTCMPGTVLYDFGEWVKNAAVPAAEDEQDMSKVKIEPELMKAGITGYFEMVGKLLSAEEIRFMPKAPGLLAHVLGMRFLTDFISGDVYFRISRPEQNLERARTQLRIAELFRDAEPVLRAALT